MAEVTSHTNLTEGTRYSSAYDVAGLHKQQQQLFPVYIMGLGLDITPLLQFVQQAL